MQIHFILFVILCLQSDAESVFYLHALQSDAESVFYLHARFRSKQIECVYK